MGIIRYSHLLAILLSLLISFIIPHQANGEKPRCNLFQGSWVFNNHSYPFYYNSTCPFITKEFNCESNGRPDLLYLHYGWKPHACTLPRFDGHDFLRRYRGKKIMFVGDSLSYNQWQSLTCMLHATVPNSPYSLVRKESLSNFTIPDYGISIMLSRNAFLVDLVKGKAGPVLKVNSIKGGDAWKGLDTLIFNTWHWWTYKGALQKWKYLEAGTRIFRDFNRLEAFEMGLKTWAQWVDTNVDPSKTKVFFQGISPSHYRGSEWGEPNVKNCAGQTHPLKNSHNLTGFAEPRAVVRSVIKKMRKPVYLLDITMLSQLRKDGHPSYYTDGSRSGMDCTHWCLAGVPDTWNQLLYAALIQK
ncbi:protein trichome birefringence-like 38 [Macadamia integrifolia]|uniref:protein trichome birefringence-like 38 n=1 Tax=Macadamia integrifolia TaxID=60698 RepID=UPI001C4EAAE0|nr:protein trichome birefringence-like 38 [Macadamia integrifolia]